MATDYFYHLVKSDKPGFVVAGYLESYEETTVYASGENDYDLYHFDAEFPVSEVGNFKSSPTGKAYKDCQVEDRSELLKNILDQRRNGSSWDWNQGQGGRILNPNTSTNPVSREDIQKKAIAAAKDSISGFTLLGSCVELLSMNGWGRKNKKPCHEYEEIEVSKGLSQLEKLKIARYYLNSVIKGLEGKKEDQDLVEFLDLLLEMLREERNIWVDSDACEQFHTFFSEEDKQYLRNLFKSCDPNPDFADGEEWDDNPSNKKLIAFLIKKAAPI